MTETTLQRANAPLWTKHNTTTIQYTHALGENRISIPYRSDPHTGGNLNE
jgi:hypothetical protein